MSTLVMIVIITTLILVLTAILIWSVLSFTDLQDSNYDKEIMEDWNYFKWIAYGLAAIWGLVKVIYKKRPKSGIDKEIAEEEKEIAELERQKEKMETLEELKRRKESLFSDVHGTESWECKWCGSDDCLKPAYTVDGIAQYYCTSCHRWLNDGSSMV